MLARFDILNFLVNTLNPVHTFKRQSNYSKIKVDTFTFNTIKWMVDYSQLKIKLYWERKNQSQPAEIKHFYVIHFLSRDVNTCMVKIVILDY